MKASPASSTWCLQRHSPAASLGPREQDHAPWQEPGEATGATGARAGDFAGVLSGPRRPLSPGECPRRPLTPAGHLHPAISGPRPPWGSETRGRGASNWPTWRQTRRPLRHVPTTAKTPCSSIRKGVPLYGWKNRGEAPRRWLSSEPRLLSLGPRSGAAHARAGPLTTSLSAGNGPRP